MSCESGTSSWRAMTAARPPTDHLGALRIALLERDRALRDLLQPVVLEPHLVIEVVARARDLRRGSFDERWRKKT